VADPDIELVLITGAGASRAFAAQGEFPLMGDWAKAVLKKLTDKGASPGHRQLVNLDGANGQSLSGPEFEARLGDFLRRAIAFDSVEPFIKASNELSDQPQGIRNSYDQSGRLLIEQWFAVTRQGVDAVREWLNEVLYEIFGSPGVNTFTVPKAYDALLQALGVTQATPMVLATTNYDRVGETALAELGRLIDWGRTPQLQQSPNAPLEVANLLGGLPRFTPVLHLHGRLGWFAKDGRLVDMQVDQYAPHWGTPIVMWPDDKKDAMAYSIPAINELWTQFGLALSRARKVVVVGHSLHDPYLVEALQKVDTPRLAITLYNAEGPSAVDTRRTMEQNLPGATPIPFEFTEHPSGLDDLAKWSGVLDRS